MNGCPLNRDLDVMPSRLRSVFGGDAQRLRIALVAVVVATAVAEVDAAYIGDVSARVIAVAENDELLVVGATGANSHVPQAFSAVLLEGLAELERPLGVEAELAPVRSPEQSAHVHTAVQGRGQDLDEGQAVVVEVFVGVAAPVDEVDPITLAHLRDAIGEVGEVGGAMHDGPHRVARAPGQLVTTDRVDARVGVGAFLVREEPLRQGHAAHHCSGSGHAEVSRWASVLW